MYGSVTEFANAPIISTIPALAGRQPGNAVTPRGLTGAETNYAAHPFNRNMFHLQINASMANQKLSPSRVREIYRDLAKAYLSSFSHGIPRDAYYDILRRHSSSGVTPPGAKTGIQSMMFQVVSNRIYLTDPYKVTRNASKPFYRTRTNEVIWLLSNMLRKFKMPDTEFLLCVHDCIQTASSNHQYHGPEFLESTPAFTVIGCNFSNNIPFPIWEGRRKNRDGGFADWDTTMKEYRKTDTTPWMRKIKQAVFRGSFRSSLFFRNQSHAHENCERIGRLHLFHLAQQHDGDRLLNVSVGGTCGGDKTKLSPLTQSQHHMFKYIIYVEGICMWSDRIRQQLFGPSTIIKQETPCGQFFEPLLQPLTHYIPTDFFLSDILSRVKWARYYDARARRIMMNANMFASNFLSLDAIETYVHVLLEEYTSLLVDKEITVEEGAIDVTDKQI